jgi:hypothetical protein
VLYGKRERNCRVAGIGIGRAVGFVIVQEQLADAAVGVIANGRRVVQHSGADRHIKIKRFGSSAVWKALAHDVISIV